LEYIKEKGEMRMEAADEEALKGFARQVRRQIVSMCHSASASHIASNLSCVELLVALYIGKVANVSPDTAQDKERDYVILSKGHASASLYATLALAGFFDKALLGTFYRNGSVLAGHPTKGCVNGVEVSTGSLGHGLGLGCGIAYAVKASGGRSKTFVITSDGELDEGSVWEAILFAGAKKLDNLFLMVDYNKIQSFGRVDEVAPLEPLEDKFRAFGWDVKRVDGNSIGQVVGALSDWKSGKPKALVADTVKGRGVSFMEDRLEWHYKSPSAQECEKALAELM
jgi:transketolase